MTKKSSGKDAKITLSFEEALERLNHIVVELEGEASDLEGSLALFAEGQRLAEYCQKQLGIAEERVKSLISTSGKLTTQAGLANGDQEIEK